MIRVMIVDDSPLVRKIAGDILAGEPDIEVVATAATAEFALNKLDREAPDVVTMDIEMPGIGGVEAIRRIMARKPTPVIVLSSHALRGADFTLQALEAGAVDFVLKPTASLSGGLNQVARELKEKVRNAAQMPSFRRVPVPPTSDGARTGSKAGQFTFSSSPASDSDERLSGRSLNRRQGSGLIDLVAIGTSTGGPVALKTVLEGLPGDFPVPIVVVQHMPPVFTKAFADRLNACSELSVKEAEEGDPLLPGTALIAPGDYHITVVRAFPQPRITLSQSDPVSGHRPSVDVLMHSVASEYGSSAVGVIMTGMGKDGAAGIKELHNKGALIIAQDKESSVIFGMNREVIVNGDADAIAPVDRIAQTLQELVRRHERVER
ncbi:MAG TPA: chemotaxis response regulator protein-glutamate methylesterase [Spirochaetia bacterium]|nr:chemotaxis response regulator protein-glutamate methylesterase [Spirochaetia bacterium]